MKRIFLLVITAAFAGLSSMAQVTTVWNPAANPESNGLWMEAANWTQGEVPDGEWKVVFNVPDAMACILDDTVSVAQFVVGDNGPGDTLIITEGGFLTGTGDWSAIGYNNPATMIVEEGGLVSFGNHMWVGLAAGADANVIINGGTVDVTGMFGLSFQGNGNKDTLFLVAGALNLAQLHPEQSIADSCLLDIHDGTVTIAGDHVSAVNTYIEAGKIIAFGGIGEVIVSEEGGNTILTGFDPTAPRDITDLMPIQFKGEFDALPWDGPGTGSPSGERLPNLFDNDVSTKYLTGMTTSWLDIITPVESVVTSYTITSANDAPERDPSDWVLLGWNQSIQDWDTLHVVEDQPSWPDFFTPQTWEFENDMAYSTYRLSIDSVNGGDLMQIAELEVFGVVGESALVDVTNWGMADLKAQYDTIPWDGPGTGSPSGEIAPYLVDNDVNTKFLSGITDTWIDILTNYESVVTGYTLYSANDAPERDPSYWALLGWNTDSARWDTLHVVEANPVWEDFFTPRSWTFENETAYSKYRLDIDSVNGAPLLQFSELELWGTLGDEVTVDITDLRDAEFKGEYDELDWSGPGSGSPPAEKLPNLFDNDVNTKYLVGMTDGYIDILTPRKSQLSSYTITSANDEPSRDPKDWMLLGLNPATLEWDTIHTVMDNPSWENFFTPKTWEIENESWYSTYRLHIMAVNGADLMQIAELELIGLVGDTVSILRPAYPTPPTVVSIDPVDGAADVAVDASIVIEFSESMDKASVEGALAVEPAVENLALSWDLWQEKLTITGDMTYSTSYTVTLGTDALDAEGDALESEVTLSFTTGEDPSTGMEEHATRKIGFYPNPATDMIFLSDQIIADVWIYNPVGQLVAYERGVSSLNISHLDPGRYIVKISDAGTISVSNLIVK